MTFQLIKKKTSAAILLAVLVFCNLKAQEAENLFHKQYSKLSFVLQPSYLAPNSAGNTDGSTYPSMFFRRDFSYQFGIHYNFAQSGAFNFKTGLVAREFFAKFDLNISNEDIGYGEDFLLNDIDTYNQFVLSVPLKTEYYLKITDKINFRAGLGFNFDYITGLSEPTYTKVGVINNSETDSKDVFFAYSEGSNNFNVTADYSLGFQYKTKFALFDLSYYTTRLLANDYVEGEYRFTNLVESPDKTGKFVIRNRFYGLSLVISPKKGWLKKKVL
jgi:hypothetical protein